MTPVELALSKLSDDCQSNGKPKDLKPAKTYASAEKAVAALESRLGKRSAMWTYYNTDGDRLRFYPRTTMTPELAERLKSCKAEVLAFMADPWPADEADEPPQCKKCSGLTAWQCMTGEWKCDRCHPPQEAIRLLKKAERIRRRYGRKAHPEQGNY